MNDALEEFDAALPGLTKMRNIAEHFDNYATDDERRHDHTVSRMGLEVGLIGETVFHWLDCSLDIDVALAAASQLFKSLQLAQSSL